ncbi:protein Hsh49p [[Candida] railenensis]|uniref:Protein Hsh49p n=1 Tax=[Candida] railenensis TaxID=45579 RepID=A0A9P0QMK2_9ASCO|nr:protein Hsh49p [[Candida] railenensis]
MNVFKRPLDSDRNVKATIYVGNLDPQVTELLLFELLIQFAPIKSLNFPKDRILKSHQGYGFAEFRSVEDAEYVLEVAKGVRLFGKTLKINKTEQNNGTGSAAAKVNQLQKQKYQQLNSFTSSSSNNLLDVGAKLFINNLNPLIDEQFLSDTFSKFGTLIRPPILLRNERGESKGHGFLSFEDFEVSDRVIEKMNGGILMNQKVEISYAFKDEVSSNGKRVRHGDRTERILAENAKSNNLIKEEGDKK